MAHQKLIVAISLILGLVMSQAGFVDTSAAVPWPSVSGERTLGAPGASPTVLLVPGFDPRPALLGKLAGPGSVCTATAAPWTAGQKNYFGQLPTWLSADGLNDIRLASYDNNPQGTPSIEKNADCLRQQILAAVQTSESGEIVLVTHSLGGLIARAYIDSAAYQEDVQKIGHNFISAVFLVSAPNQAMPFHFWLNLLLGCDNEASPQRAACEFSSTDWIRAFNARHVHTNLDTKYYLVGGTGYGGPFGFLVGTYIWLVMGPNDGTIPALSAISLPGAYQTALVKESHGPSVGSPTQFYASASEPYSAVYGLCLRPVLVMGQANGCNAMASLTYPDFLELAVGLIVILGLLGFLFLRRKKPVKGPPWKGLSQLRARFRDWWSTKPKAAAGIRVAKTSDEGLSLMSAEELSSLLAGRTGAVSGPAISIVKRSFFHVNLTSLKVELNWINWEGCSFRHAVLEELGLRNCSFRKVTLDGAQLYKADLSQSDFTNASLRQADLSHAKLAGAKFYGADLRGANLEEAELAHTYLRAVCLGPSIIQEEEEDGYLRAREIYLKLKENFQQIGAYDDASWAYYRERLMERKTFWPPVAARYYEQEEQPALSSQWGKVRFIFKYAVKWLLAMVQELTWGYGQRPFLVVLPCLVCILVFACIYGLGGGLEYRDKTVPDFGGCLMYSLASFATSSMSGLDPVQPFAQALTYFESILGVSALALFTTGLAQRMGGR